MPFPLGGLFVLLLWSDFSLLCHHFFFLISGNYQVSGDSWLSIYVCVYVYVYVDMYRCMCVYIHIWVSGIVDISSYYRVFSNHKWECYLQSPIGMRREGPASFRVYIFTSTMEDWICLGTTSFLFWLWPSCRDPTKNPQPPPAPWAGWLGTWNFGGLSCKNNYSLLHHTLVDLV